MAAKRNALSERLEGHIRFHQNTLEDAPLHGPYDLVAAFECLHDMPYPVQVLSRMRELVEPNGTALVVDMAVGETLIENTIFFGHICYTFSVLHCLPQVMDFPGTAGTGTVMTPSKLRDYAKTAGFGRIEVLPIEIPKWRFYLLTHYFREIRTKDLRVMSGKPVSATSDLQARLFDPARRREVLADLTRRDWLVNG